MLTPPVEPSISVSEPTVTPEAAVYLLPPVESISIASPAVIAVRSDDPPLMGSAYAVAAASAISIGIVSFFIIIACLRLSKFSFLLL